MRTRRRGIPAALALDWESRSKAHIRGRKDAGRGSPVWEHTGVILVDGGRGIRSSRSALEHNRQTR